MFAVRSAAHRRALHIDGIHRYASTKAFTESTSLLICGKRMKVTATNDPKVVDRWVTSHILQPKVELPDPSVFSASAAVTASPLPLVPIGLDCEFTAAFSRGQRPKAATVQLATCRRLLPDGRFVGEDAVLVAHLLSMGQSAPQSSQPPRGDSSGSVVPRSLVDLFSRGGCDRVLPVGQEVGQDVQLLARALRIDNPPQIKAPGPVELLRELHRSRPARSESSSSDATGSTAAAGGRTNSTMLIGELTMMHYPLQTASNQKTMVRSLQDLAVMYSGFPRWKKKAVTMSCWDRWPLTRPQLAYAAIDAYASLDVFCSLTQVAALLHDRGVRAGSSRRTAPITPRTASAGDNSDSEVNPFESGTQLAKLLRSPYYGQAVDAALACG